MDFDTFTDGRLYKDYRDSGPNGAALCVGACVTKGQTFLDIDGYEIWLSREDTEHLSQLLLLLLKENA